jgi:hypothetical protein
MVPEAHRKSRARTVYLTKSTVCPYSIKIFHCYNLGLLMRNLALLFCALLPGLARSQVVTAANSVSFQPMVTRDADGYSRCGVRVVVAALEESQKSTTYDFSITMSDDTFTLIKAGSYRLPFDKKTGWTVGKLTPVIPAPDSLWIGKRDEEATLKPKNYMPAETPGFVLGGGDASTAAKIMWAIAREEPMQVALHYPRARYDDVIGFTAQVSPGDRATFDACFRGLYKRMAKNAPKNN